MFSKPFEEMGIPQGYGFKPLLFSPFAKALVLQTCSAMDNWRPERLLYRHLAWDRYSIIANLDHLISQESPFLHSSKPLVAYVSTQHQFSLDEEGKKFFRSEILDCSSKLPCQRMKPQLEYVVAELDAAQNVKPIAALPA